MVNQTNLATRIYRPRETLPLSTIIAALPLTRGLYHLDCCIAQGETGADLCHWRAERESRAAFPEGFRMDSGHTGSFWLPAQGRPVDAP